MIACAFLGANVVGSDVDGDCLGKAPIDIPLKVCQSVFQFASRSVCYLISQRDSEIVDQSVSQNAR